jgi:hypothetical protein
VIEPLVGPAATDGSSEVDVDREQPHSLAAAFVDFVLGEEGQSLLAD